MASVHPCFSDNQCDNNYFCNTHVNPGRCDPETPIGSACGLQTNKQNKPIWNGKCADQGKCFVNSTDPYVVNGTCTALNSFPTGSVIFQGSVDKIWYYSAVLGKELCVSGLGVPVANSTTGYPISAFKCVASVNETQLGQPCGSCSWNDFGSFGACEYR